MSDTEKENAIIEIVELAMRGGIHKNVFEKQTNNVGKGVGVEMKRVLELAAKAGLIGDREGK